MTKPNIIIIQCDSMDGRAMGNMGHPAMKRATPAMDAMAARGVRFDNCYSNSPVCCPSRASMWSGKYAHECEAWNNHKGLSPEDPIAMDRLEENGYSVGRFGKLDYLSGAHTLRARISPWTNRALIERPCYAHNAPTIIPGRNERNFMGDWDNTDRAIEWIKNAKNGGKPFMTYLGIHKPHPSFAESQNYLDLIDADAIEMPPPDETGHYSIKFNKIQMNWRFGFDKDSVLRTRHIYLAMIAEVDAMLAHFFKSIQGLGLEKDTYFIFLSDHGETCFEHELYYKMLPYEPSTRVPMIITGPGIKPGSTVKELTSLVDVYPTLMEMAGIEQPGGLSGYSLMPEALNKKSKRPNWIISDCFDSAIPCGWFMVRQGDWKYVLYPGYEPLLFNLKEDRWEVKNAAKGNPGKTAAMDKLMRSVVDVDEVTERNERYNKASFKRWREAHKAGGDYAEQMAKIFSGWDYITPDETKPWTDQDEARIKAWLGEK